MASATSKKLGGVVGVILAAVFAVEGGYVNDSRDPGGETNHGITKKVAVAHGYTGDMRKLTQEAAASIYYEDYIAKPGFVPMIELAPAVAEELVDTAVNTGASKPSRWFQTALNSLSKGGTDYPMIEVDGKVGSKAIASYKALQKARGSVKACELVLKLLDSQQAVYYMSLDKLNVYTAGWVMNRIGNVPVSKCKNYTGGFNATPST